MTYCEDCSSYDCGCSERKEIASLRQQLTEALDENLRLQVVADDVRSAYAKALRDTDNELRQVIAAKQARIDELMHEYCHEDMTNEQLINWAAHQRVKED